MPGFLVCLHKRKDGLVEEEDNWGDETKPSDLEVKPRIYVYMCCRFRYIKIKHKKQQKGLIEAKVLPPAAFPKSISNNAISSINSNLLLRFVLITRECVINENFILAAQNSVTPAVFIPHPAPPPSSPRGGGSSNSRTNSGKGSFIKQVGIELFVHHHLVLTI